MSKITAPKLKLLFRNANDDNEKEELIKKYFSSSVKTIQKVIDNEIREFVISNADSIQEKGSVDISSIQNKNLSYSKVNKNNRSSYRGIIEKYLKIKR